MENNIKECSCKGKKSDCKKCGGTGTIRVLPNGIESRDFPKSTREKRQLQIQIQSKKR